MRLRTFPRNCCSAPVHGPYIYTGNSYSSGSSAFGLLFFHPHQARTQSFLRLFFRESARARHGRGGEFEFMNFLYTQTRRIKIIYRHRCSRRIFRRNNYGNKIIRVIYAWDPARVYIYTCSPLTRATLWGNCRRACFGDN